MGYTFGSSMVVEGADRFALPDHIESLFGDIHICHDILAFVCFANEEFVLGGKGDPATFANQTNERHLALYQLKITPSPIVVGGWIAKPGMGGKLLGCFSLQSR